MRETDYFIREISLKNTNFYILDLNIQANLPAFIGSLPLRLLPYGTTSSIFLTRHFFL